MYWVPTKRKDTIITSTDKEFGKPLNKTTNFSSPVLQLELSYIFIPLEATVIMSLK